jgi:hypothetical protein
MVIGGAVAAVAGLIFTLRKESLGRRRATARRLLAKSEETMQKHKMEASTNWRPWGKTRALVAATSEARGRKRRWQDSPEGRRYQKADMSSDTWGPMCPRTVSALFCFGAGDASVKLESFEFNYKNNKSLSHIFIFMKLNLSWAPSSALGSSGLQRESRYWSTPHSCRHQTELCDRRCGQHRQNVCDRADGALTPVIKGKADREITQKVRKALVIGQDYSATAKNIKINTINGGDTRAPVKMDGRKWPLRVWLASRAKPTWTIN